MITLTILKADGTTYWTEHFSSLALAQAWIAIEQKRPYWDATWTFSLVDHSPSPSQVAQDQAALLADQADTETKRQALKALLPANISTLADVKAALVVIHAFLKKM